MRFFMLFDASRKEFFKGCRQFIGVNGYFLKGLYKGMLLSATNYAIYPLAVCLVDNGNTVLGILHGDIVWVDRQQWWGGFVFYEWQIELGIESIKEGVPSSSKEILLLHIYRNFKQKFTSLLLRKPF